MSYEPAQWRRNPKWSDAQWEAMSYFRALSLNRRPATPATVSDEAKAAGIVRKLCEAHEEARRFELENAEVWK